MRKHRFASPKGLAASNWWPCGLSTIGDDIPDDLRQMILEALAD
jgi:hypothetical protein